MKTILIIDDDLDTTYMLMEVLGLEGYEVETASTGEQGLQRLGEVKPDLVLCDVLLPALDGRAVASAIKADPAYNAIPVVLMSASPQFSSAADAVHTPFLSKPFALTTLVTILQKQIGSA